MAELKSFNYDNVKEVNAVTLMEKSFVQDVHIVDNLLPAGVGLFGTPQKTGKTFFALQLALSVSTGDNFFDRKVNQGHVLYIALEDAQSAFQKRIQRFKMPITDNLDFLFERAYSKTFDLENVIKEYKNKNSDLRLVIIDTFAKIRNKPKAEYDVEYEEVTAIHELALKYNICILLVTHVKKKIDFNNPFDSIYGSRGVTAAADGMIVMLKERNELRLKNLFIIGKDIPEQKLYLEQDNHLIYSVNDAYDKEQDDDEDITKVIHYSVRNTNGKTIYSVV